MAESSMLPQGATLLLHDEKNHIVPKVAELLVKGQIFTKIGENIQAGTDAKEPQYKGCHADQTFFEYMPAGDISASSWSKEDLFWGQLAEALEFIDAGTTTIVDHSSCNTTADHPQAAIQADLSAKLQAHLRMFADGVDRCFTGSSADRRSLGRVLT
ncbi:Uu.00g117170.m01.CDS01 [Anthostomella pinea]|uniref:Uu.00g117170.m01.CDS01 n=1 Tax=Anthostomella pinea TaxID=933095 RepID=A0AAI8VG77_9PEZI|nr:Uu.00g117170.m01.CDS01 [Anthostomella pinea]